MWQNRRYSFASFWDTDSLRNSLKRLKRVFERLFMLIFFHFETREQCFRAILKIFSAELRHLFLLHSKDRLSVRCWKVFFLCCQVKNQHRKSFKRFFSIVLMNFSMDLFLKKQRNSIRYRHRVAFNLWFSIRWYDLNSSIYH